MQDRLRAHENFETRPVVEGADEPGIAVHPSGDTPGISPPLPGPQGAPATVGFDQEVGRAETGLQGEHDSGGKDGINETGGVTGEQDAPRGEGRKLPAVVAGGAQRSDASGGVQTLGDSGCGGHGGSEEVIIIVFPFNFSGGENEADGHPVAGQRNEPEPSAGGADDGDMTFGFAFVAGGAFKMCVDGDAADFLRAATAQSGPGTGEGTAPAGIDNPAGGQLGPSRRSFGVESNRRAGRIVQRRDARFLMHGATVFTRVLEKELVERGAFHLVGVFVLRGEVLAEPEAVLPFAVGRAEFRAVFAEKAGLLEFVPDTDFLEQVVAVRQKGFAHAEAGKFFLFENGDTEPGARESGAGGATGRATADDGDIAGLTVRSHEAWAASRWVIQPWRTPRLCRASRAVAGSPMASPYCFSTAMAICRASSESSPMLSGPKSGVSAWMVSGSTLTMQFSTSSSLRRSIVTSAIARFPI